MLSNETLDAVRVAAKAELARRRLLDYCEMMDPRFIPAGHLQLIAGYLEKLERREIMRLCVTLPPRHGKTRLVSQLFASWYVGRNPEHDVILASYGSELAEGNSRAVRTLVTDDRFPFPGMSLREDSRSVGRWQTEQGGTLVAVGVGAGLTGRGGHLIVCDDLIKDREAADSDVIRASTRAWYGDVLQTRAAPGAVRIMIGTRWRTDDILSDVVDRDGWVTVNLPLISDGEGDVLNRPPGEWLWPARFTPDDIPSVERGEISSRSFEALYQQRPIPAGGLIFDPAWMKQNYKRAPTRYSACVIQTIDSAWKTGVGNDPSAIATWATDGSRYYIIDQWFGRVAYTKLLDVVTAKYLEHLPQAVFVEEAQSGYAILDELLRSTTIPLKGIRPRGSKESRAESIAPLFEAGLVYLPESAPWLKDWIDEHSRFPAGRHDDMVDTTSMALRILHERNVRLLQFEQIREQSRNFSMAR